MSSDTNAIMGTVLGIGLIVLAICGGCVVAGQAPAIESSGQDAWLYQESAVLDEWHHVATLHGWADDLGVCREIVEFLERTGDSRYTCRVAVE